MPKITLDAALSSKLHAFAQDVELCDPDGRVLGRFIPRVDMSEWEPISPDVSEEEEKTDDPEGHLADHAASLASGYFCDCHNVASSLRMTARVIESGAGTVVRDHRQAARWRPPGRR